MMKVSDPIIFGHVVKAYFADVFAQLRRQASPPPGSTPNNGLGAILAGLGDVEGGDEIAAAFAADLAARPAPVVRRTPTRASRTCTSPRDVIVDASMPALVRNGGKLWGVDGGEDDTLAVIPDSSYAGVYQAVDRRRHRERTARPRDDRHRLRTSASWRRPPRSTAATTRPSRSRPPASCRSSTATGEVLIEHDVQHGRHLARDADEAHRGRRLGASGRQPRPRHGRARRLLARRQPLARRAAHREGRTRRSRRSTPHGLQISILAPEEATRYTLARMRHGLDTISVTGNVLRDYLTDLFPILEVGTSAKMLSIVPLLAGGGLFETGAGGSAPKHVQQLVEENYLRWDSLGEFFALAASLEHLADLTGNAKRAGARRHAGCRNRHVPRERQVAGSRAGHDRQPRQPLLPRAVLGAGAGGADGRPRAGGALRPGRRGARRERADDRRRAARGAGHSRRDRRLLPPGRRARSRRSCGRRRRSTRSSTHL